MCAVCFSEYHSLHCVDWHIQSHRLTKYAKVLLMQTMGHSNRNGELFFLQKLLLNDISQFNYVSSTRSSILPLSSLFWCFCFVYFWSFFLSSHWISLMRAHHSFFVEPCNLISTLFCNPTKYQPTTNHTIKQAQCFFFFLFTRSNFSPTEYWFATHVGIFGKKSEKAKYKKLE